MRTHREPPQLFVPGSSLGFCGVIAVAVISATDMATVRRAALPVIQGEGGLKVYDTVRLAEDFMGRPFDTVYVFTDKPSPQTFVPIPAREAAREVRLGILVTQPLPGADHGHGMPIVEGGLYNKGGHGDVLTKAIYEWKPKRGEIARVIRMWGR